MTFPLQFIAAGREYSSLTEFVPAPYLRKSVTLDEKPDGAELLICGLGFYELFINGQRLTKGLLAPYISNPDHMLYYDCYEIASHLQPGENVIGVLLGNGFQNNPGGYVWDFHKPRFRGAPQLAMSLELSFAQSETITITADESFRTAPSPIWNDDYRNGEYYDARKETPGWAEPGFDDSAWGHAICAPTPRGEAALCTANPILISEELSPVSVKQVEGGYLYDFGENFTGFCRLELEGEAGQEIALYYGEYLEEDGRFTQRNLRFDENDYVQKDLYICKGGQESYTPCFTYHGFQYVLVKGLTLRQATPQALTFLVFHSALQERGGFSCSDETVNRLQASTLRADLSNFFYFPTDCPHREKNGWTGDASVSAEHILLNFEAEENYRVWLANIRKAQAGNGALPGIVPTGDWGYHWGNGPAWDCVLTYLPYYTYLYRGNKNILSENAHAILRYLEYLSTNVRDDGLICFGLGDWCPPDRGADSYKSPLEFTDTVISMDICEKAAYIFSVLQLPLQEQFARGLYKQLYTAARERLIERDGITAIGRCQTSQAMAVYYNIFTPAEKPAAVRVLLELIRQENDHFDVGILGARVLFHVLSDFGYTDLALKLIVQPTFPAYGWWIANGATTLWEDFHSTPGSVNSRNHHFWGDISHWFIRHLAGIHYNPRRVGKELDICPQFAQTLTFAKGHHRAPEGEICVAWKREGDAVLLDVTAPGLLDGYIRMPGGMVFEDGTSVKALESGTYRCVPAETRAL